MPILPHIDSEYDVPDLPQFTRRERVRLSGAWLFDETVQRVIAVAPLSSDSEISDSGLTKIDGPDVSEDEIHNPVIRYIKDDDGCAVFSAEALQASAVSALNQYVETEASPEDYPRDIMDINNLSGRDVTIGDLHGNAMAMVHYLVKIGLLQLSPQQYLELNKAYKIVRLNDIKHNPKELDLAITIFCSFITDAIIVHPKSPDVQKPMIRFIGDTLCDRGANDFLTLNILRKLKLSCVDYQVIWSNHDSLFLQEYYRTILKPEGFGNYMHSLISESDYNSYYNSLFSMQEAMVNPNVTIVTSDKIKSLVEKFYLPNLTAISSELRADGILDVFTHAPICLSQILNNEAVVKLLFDNGVDVDYAKSSQHEFLNVINIINRYFVTNLPQIIKGINYIDKTEVVTRSLLTSKGFREKFKKDTGVELELVILFENILANQRYYNEGIDDLFTYYIQNPSTSICFGHRKYNGHDDIKLGICRLPADELSVSRANARLRMSQSLNSSFGNDRLGIMGIKESRASFLIAPRKIGVASPVGYLYHQARSQTSCLEPGVRPPSMICMSGRGFRTIPSVLK